ncbi:uncharacterized protein LOC142174339 [Nicotiana tabacum]|uniref:Uncharacterized protein LOC142174339 n=1 Tax=Nicotiana tabacum TaxID=4097 RepID=A0AC58TG80_TOBAC
MDLFGPTRTASIGGKRYTFVIVDDYSRFTWVIFWSHKDEALRNFEVFCKRVERKRGHLISTIQSDHGGEFESRAFKDFCNDQGYTHNFSAPRSPQQNGVMERKKRTLQNMARTMLLENSLPNHFWAEGDKSESQESINTPAATESTSENSSNMPDPQIKSTTNAVPPNEWRSEPEYPQKFIIGDPNEGIKTRASLKKKANIALISQIEPKKIEEALKDSSWVQAMQEELDQFSKNQVWKLIPKLDNVSVIETKWVFRNKLNEDGKIIRNKARLVAQGYSQ